MKRSSSIHDRGIQELILNLKDKYQIMIPNLEYPNRYRIKGEIDLVGIHSAVWWDIYEYKCRCCDQNRAHARKQLQRAKDFLKNKVGLEKIVGYYVCGHFDIQRMFG